YWVGSAGGSTNSAANWSTAANACGVSGGASVPGTSDVARFTSSCTNNATVDAAFSVLGVDMQSGYTGTVTQSGSTITVGTSDWIQADGTFTGGTNTIDINDAFTFSGGTFTSTSGALFVANAFTISGSANFNPSTGTVRFEGASSYTLTTNNATFNDVEFFHPSGGSATITLADNFTVSGTMSIDQTTSSPSNFIISPSGTRSITLLGNLIIRNTKAANYVAFGSTSLTINMTGAGDQSLTQGSSGDNRMQAAISIDKSGGVAKLNSNFAFRGPLTITAGDTLDVSPDGGSTVYKPTFAHNFTNAGTFTIRTAVPRIDCYQNSTVSTGGMTFSDLEFIQSAGYSSCTKTLADDFTINGTLSIDMNASSSNYTVTPSGTRTVNVGGDITINNSAAVNNVYFGTSGLTLNMNGASDQIVTQGISGNNFLRAGIAIDKSGGVAKLGSNVSFNGPLIIT
ncbi:MAG: hypothetical protein K8I00_12470, partial [Candidatus Omnitrophica bacterium]|nr:hypothetical protein [Candidatus Omnitrophota bacterium]